MEERLPPPEEKPLPPPPGCTALETYVVQIPRDQIYRIPPPEHAQIVEHHNNRSSTNNKTMRHWSSLCWAVVAAALLIILAGIAALAIRATLYSPKPPEFSIVRVQAKNLVDQTLKDDPHHRRRTEFDVTVRAHNTNARMSVSYQVGGEASLGFKNRRVGQGRINKSSSEIRQEPGGAAVDFPMVLFGNGAVLPPEVRKNLGGDVEKPMSLEMESTVEINSWAGSERLDLKVSCNFRVRNSLISKTKITFQECRAGF